jgi:hypothetical protein
MFSYLVGMTVLIALLFAMAILHSCVQRQDAQISLSVDTEPRTGNVDLNILLPGPNNIFRSR